MSTTKMSRAEAPFPADRSRLRFVAQVIAVGAIGPDIALQIEQ